MRDVIKHLYEQPKSYLTALGFFFVILVGLFDYLTGQELSFSIFYLIPIFLITRLMGKWIGIMISVVSAIVWLIADFTVGHIYAHPTIPYWNMSVRLGTFLIIIFLLSTLKHEKELGRTDSLTGIANRRYFIELAYAEINRVRRYKHPFTIVHIDIDNFKTINDRYGHSTGDTLLCLMVNTLRNNIRETDTVARLGGDEFVILLPETGPEPAEVITQKFQKVSLDVMQKNGWPLTLSMGVVIFISPPSTVDEMLKISDDIMYAAKSDGKNTIKYKVFGK